MGLQLETGTDVGLRAHGALSEALCSGVAGEALGLIFERGASERDAWRRQLELGGQQASAARSWREESVAAALLEANAHAVTCAHEASRLAQASACTVEMVIALAQVGACAAESGSYRHAVLASRRAEGIVTALRGETSLSTMLLRAELLQRMSALGGDVSSIRSRLERTVESIRAGTADPTRSARFDRLVRRLVNRPGPGYATLVSTRWFGVRDT